MTVQCPPAFRLSYVAIIIIIIVVIVVGRDSSVGIVTCYGLDGMGIESLWEQILRTC